MVKICKLLILSTLILLSVVILPSCEYNKYYEENCGLNEENNLPEPKGDYIVSFKTNVSNAIAESEEIAYIANSQGRYSESRVIDETQNTPLPIDRYMNVYTYYYRGEFIGTTTFKTETAGVPTPARSPLRVKSGDYEFYLFAINNKNQLPTQTLNEDNAWLTGLSNGYDYLSGSLINQTVNSDVTFDLALTHACAQIIINVIKDGSPVTDITSATIQQPDPSSCALVLGTGLILASTKLDSSPINMIISGSSVNQIIVPYSNSKYPDLAITVTAGGETYNGSASFTNGKIAGGTSYEFTLELNSDFTVTPSDITVKDWTVVDDNGDPIIAT